MPPGHEFTLGTGSSYNFNSIRHMQNAAFKSTYELQSNIRLTRIELKYVAFN